MQTPLFDASRGGPNESLSDVYREMLEKTEMRFPGKVFVLGTGPEDARVAVVGESPGPPDIASKKPFNGPAGDLLIRILGSIGLRSSDCYLTNVVKFISQGDEITPDVLAFFAPYLRRELNAIDPEVVISLGNSPTKAILETKKPISQLRGQFFEVDGRRVMPTFNPAYLLRDASKKKEVWDDMKMVREFLSTK